MLVLVAACGAQSAPPPKPSAPPPAPPRVVGPPAPVTCGDVGVLLRGDVNDDREAGPVKEATIARACLHDKWPREVIECVGSATRPTPCLDKLTKEQLAAYHKKLLAWSDAFPGEDVAIEDELVDDVAFVDCAQGIGDVTQYAPVVTVTGKPREVAVSLRRYHVLELCEGWDMTVRQCFSEGKAPAQCRKLLDPDQEQDIVDRLADADALIAKVAAVKPPFTCDRAVKAHYADARWKGVLAKAKDRAAVIAKSRKLMLDACTNDKWSENLRACLIAAGADACFHASGIAPWGFPPSAIPIKTGIPECDSYGDALRALLNCSAIPKQAAQTMLDSFQKSAGAYANMLPPARTAAANSCKQSDSAIRQSGRSLGCTF